MKFKLTEADDPIMMNVKFTPYKREVRDGEEDLGRISPEDDWEDEFSDALRWMARATPEAGSGEIVGIVSVAKRDIGVMILDNTTPYDGQEVLFQAVNNMFGNREAQERGFFFYHPDTI